MARNEQLHRGGHRPGSRQDEHHRGAGTPRRDETLDHEAMDRAVHGRDIEHAPHDTEAVPKEATTVDHGPMDRARHGRHAERGHAEHAHAGHGVSHVGHEEMFRRRFWVSLALSIPVLLYSEAVQGWLGFTMPTFPGSAWITPVFSVIVFAYGGVLFLRMAVPELRRGQPGMMTLISLAISVAFVYSLASLFIAPGTAFFWELVTLIDIMLLGHWIEMRSVRQASRSLDELVSLMPDIAERISEDSRVTEVPVSELRQGDLVLVRPGASVPADGEVVEGESDVDESMITGESRPVDKELGSEVVAGTINGNGSLRVRVTATGEETALAGIMRLVREAQESKSRTQVLADRAAGWLFYVALGVAIIAAVAWTIAAGFGVTVVSRVATVLVTACPHALGLAIPLVVAITTTLGARNGILLRDRLAMEQARDVDVVLFDKTGTLTRGEQGLVAAATVEGVDEDRALALAAAVEGDSEHMIARAIREAADERGLSLPRVTGFEAMKGRGVRAERDGEPVYVGGPNLLEELGLEPPATLHELADEAGKRGQTIVYAVEDHRVTSGFALADVVRPESREAVRSLRGMGIEVAMVTGDSEDVARAVAAELGIERYFARVLPEHKDQRVKELQQQGHRVAMVGDGVNDAPALVQADVGIAIGSGTDVAVESAGIILVRSDPRDVAKVIELSRATYRKMIQNLLWATGYNVVALPLAAGVLAPLGIVLSPAGGALLMSLSTVIVALNAQLLRRLRLGG